MESANVKDRVRKNTDEVRNRKIDQKTINRIFKYKGLPEEEITARLNKLHREWDVERALEVNASTLGVMGLILGRISGKAWYLLPVLTSVFLLQNGIQGWCPPLPLLRRLGFRTRQEIDEEIYALKALRGDFDALSSASGPIEVLASFRD